MKKYTQSNFLNSALITIDIQSDTLDGQPLEIPGTSAILPKVRMILDIFRDSGKPIVHIIRIYKKDASNVDLCRKEDVENGAQIFLESTPGCEIASTLFSKSIKLNYELLLNGMIQDIGNNEVIIYKPRWGAFYRSSLESHLNNLGVDTLIIMGCNFPNCPRTTIYEASERDYRIVMVEDAVSGLYEKGKEEMLRISVEVITSETIRNKIKK